MTVNEDPATPGKAVIDVDNITIIGTLTFDVNLKEIIIRS